MRLVQWCSEASSIVFVMYGPYCVQLYDLSTAVLGERIRMVQLRAHEWVEENR